MNTEIENIMNKQWGKIPPEMQNIVASSEWRQLLGDFSRQASLTEEQEIDFRLETLLVLLGLVHPDLFQSTLAEQLGVDEASLNTLVTEVEEKIFVLIRPALIQFFESEKAMATGVGALPSAYSNKAPIEIQPPEQALLLEKAPDVAPKNFPIEKGPESFLPSLIPKVTPPDSVPVHPFEEKMKMVFTGTAAEIGNIVLAPPEAMPVLAQILPDQSLSEQTPHTQTNTPSIPPATESLRHDPYREATA